MRYPYSGTKIQTPDERWQTRQQVTDFVRQRGTEKPPAPPRDIIPQSSSRGVFLVWALPPGQNQDIAGWRIYKDDENTLLDKIPDRGTRKYFVPASSGSTPPTINIFVSSVNSLGVESAKVQVQAKATAETGAPSIPSVPTGYTQGGGSDTTGGLGTRTISNSTNGSPRAGL